MAEKGPASAPARAGDAAEPRLVGLVGAGALAALLFSAQGFVPVLAPLSLVSPLPLVLQRLRGGMGGALLAAALAAALVGAAHAPAPAAGFVLLAAGPGLLMGESLARGRGLLRGCAWAFALLATVVAAGLIFASDAMAERGFAFFNELRSPAFLDQLKAGGWPPDRIATWSEYCKECRDVFAVVFPAAYMIGAAVTVLVNAGLLRLYLLRRDPGWLEDGEFERVRWPLGLVAAFILSGAAVALPPARSAAYNVLLVVAFFFALQGLAVVAFYARRLAGPPLLRWVVVLLVLANPWAPQILALLGLFDNWFDFRRWAEPPPERG